MGAFFHAVEVFFHHLQEVKWTPLGFAIACHVAKLLLRARAWQNIVRASYPEGRLKYRSALGAYAAGVGVNSIAPARGGDLIKLYLVKHRMTDARYPTLAATLVVETLFDFFVAGGMMIWALTLGVLPAHQVYSRIPTVDWKFVLRHERASAIALVVLSVVAVIGFLWARRRVEDFWERVKLGFVILQDRSRFFFGVIVPQALSWVLRLATIYFMLRAFGVRATMHNALLAQVVDSLSTLFPATPGGAGTKQGLIVYVFRNSAISKTLLLAFSVGMNIALTIANVLLGLIAMGLMAHTLSFKKLRARANDEQPAEG
ncbi:MAG TPA: lysylphosphatidylglycerol synthase transmembrane domain-containing protein [Gaiellaceae bacterium]|nr:lysylphosphatidylglycerol synthase transmembrane domain-containing protein [Gaiellaceae bacterium]